MSSYDDDWFGEPVSVIEMDGKVRTHTHTHAPARSARPHSSERTPSLLRADATRATCMLCELQREVCSSHRFSMSLLPSAFRYLLREFPN
eukprot:6190286-Pleurochrysis_carterae.AAC.1